MSLSKIGGWLGGIIVLLASLGMIALFLFMYNLVQGQGEQTKDSATSQMAALGKQEYSLYDNKVVTGTEVMEAANRYIDKPQFSIRIVTGLVPDGFYAYNRSSEPDGVCYAPPTGSNTEVSPPSTCATNTMVKIEQMKSTTNTNFVNPTGRFRAKVYVDANQEPRLIEFVQM